MCIDGGWVSVGVACFIQFQLLGNYWRCIPVDEEQEEVVPCQTRLQDHLGSENETQAKQVRMTCEFRLYKLLS